MNRKNLSVGFLFAVVALAACSSQGGAPIADPSAPAEIPPTDPTTPSEDTPTATPAPTPAPLAVPRQFDCDPSAVIADTLLTPLPAATDTLVLRPSGTACANHVIVKSGASEHTISTAPGMVALAGGENVGSSLVVCLSNERHSAIPGGPSPLGRYTDGVQLECAVRTPSGWSPTLAVTPPSAADAAWLVAIQPDATAPDRLTVRWFRDSYFQFLHMVQEGRPATDGIYDTTLTVTDGKLVVGDTKKLDGAWFEEQILTPPEPTP